MGLLVTGLLVLLRPMIDTQVLQSTALYLASDIALQIFAQLRNVGKLSQEASWPQSAFQESTLGLTCSFLKQEVRGVSV